MSGPNLKVVLTPLTWQLRVFDTADGEAGKTPPVGSAHVSLDEFGQANITGLVIEERCRCLSWWGSAHAELVRIGARCVAWTMLVNGEKRKVCLTITRPDAHP